MRIASIFLFTQLIAYGARSYFAEPDTLTAEQAVKPDGHTRFEDEVPASFVADAGQQTSFEGLMHVEIAYCNG